MDQSNIDEDGLVEAGIPPSVAEETEEPVSDDEIVQYRRFEMQMSKNPLKKMSGRFASNEPIVEEPSKRKLPGSSSLQWNGTVAQFKITF